MGIEFDDERKKRLDRAISYKQMFEMWAWKDFQSILSGLRESTVNDFISFEAKEAVEFKAGQYKGFLDCLRKIQSDLEFITKDE